jgi:hypothetical protein
LMVLSRGWCSARSIPDLASSADSTGGTTNSTRREPPRYLIQSGTEGLNVQFSGSGPVVKERTRSADQGTSRNRRCARSLRPGIREGNRQSKALRCRSGADRGCPTSALGKSSASSEGCAYSSKTDALGGRAQEDRRCAEGAMGKGEGGEEDGLTQVRCRTSDQLNGLFSTDVWLNHKPSSCRHTRIIEASAHHCELAADLHRKRIRQALSENRLLGR